MAAEEPKEVMGFKLGQFLGSGGFGFVKEASLNGKDFAMKVLIKDGWTGNEEEMVRSEIEIMEKLDHPNLIKVISFLMNASYPRESGAEDCVIIVMELARGVSLFDILYFTDGFPEEITRTYLTQLVGAIGHMHKQGIAHRDIKPQNTLLDNNFNLKVCDFGLSKETGGASLMNTRLGTLAFQAPEILMSRPYDFGVDIFALGVMFFLMLTGGIPPFKSAATTDKWFKCIAGKVQEKFWKKQKKAAKKIKETCGEKMGLAAELFFWMCAYQPTERATLQDCSTHEWFNHEKMEGEKLKTVMKAIVNDAMARKREDPELGCQVSKAMRGMTRGTLDLTKVAPEDPSRYIFGFTYAIANNEHPYILFKSIEDYLKEKQEVADEDIEFDEDKFTMNVQIEFVDQTVAKVLICAYREDGVDYLSFEKDKKAGVLAVNMLIEKIITRHCQQLGDMKLDDVKEQPLSESQINDVREHMKKMMEGGEN